MTLQDTLDTYQYLIKHLDQLKVIYITLVRYVESADPRIQGSTVSRSPLLLFTVCESGRRRGTPHDVLEAYREHIQRPYLFLNAGITVPEAEDLLDKGLVDAVAFGRLWISHPDLQHRIEYRIPLDNVIDFKNLNGNPGVDPRKGYTDYPSAPSTVV